MVIEVLTAVLVIALAAASVLAGYIGVLGLTGALRFARCERCDHLTLRAGPGAPHTCGTCRHDRLLHPLYAVRHAHVAYWSQHAPRHR